MRRLRRIADSSAYSGPFAAPTGEANRRRYRGSHAVDRLTPRAGDWLRERLDDPWNGTMHAVVPHGFPAYARILHPAIVRSLPDRRGADARRVREDVGGRAPAAPRPVRRRARDVGRDGIRLRHHAAPAGAVAAHRPHPARRRLAHRASPPTVASSPPRSRASSRAELLAVDRLAPRRTHHDSGCRFRGALGGSRRSGRLPRPRPVARVPHVQRRPEPPGDARPQHPRSSQQRLPQADLAGGHPVARDLRGAAVAAAGPRPCAVPRRCERLRATPTGCSTCRGATVLREEHGFPPSAQSPSDPAGRTTTAWAMVSEIDYDSTIVAGSVELWSRRSAPTNVSKRSRSRENADLTWDADEVNR